MRLLYLCAMLIPGIVQSVQDIHMFALFPMEGPWHGGLAAMTAAEIALDHINTKENFLPGYRLHLMWNNSKCNAGHAVQMMYSNFYNPPKKTIFYAAGCSFVSEATAQGSHYWNLVQMSFGSVSPALSDKSTYPRFFRANSPEVDGNPAKIAIFKKFRWSKIATIHQAIQLHSSLTDELLQRVRSENMTVLRSEVVTKGPSSQIKNLKEVDARIIVGSFYEPVGRQAYCEAYKINLYGRNVIFFFNGWYESKWWMTPDSGIDCTPEQLAQVVEGAFFVERVKVNPKNEVTISGIRPTEFLEMYRERTNNETLFGESIISLSYDTMWTMALALNATITELDESGNNYTLEDFSYTDDTVGSVIFNNMKKTSFMGASGHMSFNEKGDPIGMFVIKRIQNGEPVVVGFFDPRKEEGSQIEWVPDAIVWEDNKVPRDSVLRVVEETRLSLPLYICICCIAGLGALISIFFLCFNVYFRDVREVKMSSPRLNNMTLIGCLLLYTTPFLENVTSDTDVFSCTAKGFVLTIGFSLAFGALFAKTWRVHIIFTNSTNKKKIVKDTQLLAMVAGLVAINMVVLFTWALYDPMVVVVHDMDPVVKEEEDVLYQGVLKMCESPNQTYFMATIFALQGILMLLGAFLAWETRKVKVDGLNDSKMIGMSVYNVLVLSLLGVTVSMALKFQININYALSNIVIILATTVTQCLIFAPKILAVKNKSSQIDQVGDGGTATGVTGTTTLAPGTASVTAQRLIALERALLEEKKETKRLKTILDDNEIKYDK